MAFFVKISLVSFEVLQLNLRQSGKSVKDYLHEAGVNYSTYNYWRKKLSVKDNPKSFFISRFVSKTCNLNGRKVSPCIL